MDLRNRSVTVDDRIISTNPLPEQARESHLKLNTPGSKSGQSGSARSDRPDPVRVSVGSDTLLELKTGIGQLDSGSLAPLDREPIHARNKTLNPLEVGRERNDTGQAPVKLETGYNPDVFARAVLRGLTAASTESSSRAALGRTVDFLA